MDFDFSLDAIDLAPLDALPPEEQQAFLGVFSERTIYATNYAEPNQGRPVELPVPLNRLVLLGWVSVVMLSRELLKGTFLPCELVRYKTSPTTLGELVASAYWARGNGGR